jgi:putative oxidoreductase
MIDRARAEAVTFTLVRVVCGIFMACHGFQKLFGVWGHTVPLASQLGVGAIIELVGGVLVALGLFARPAAFVVAGQMAVAYFQFHWKLSFSDWKFMPMVNGGEIAVVFCFVFLFISAHGAGPHSLDARRNHA